MKFSCNNDYDNYVIHVFVISLQLCHPTIYHSNLSPTIYLSKSIPPFSNYWLYIREDYILFLFYNSIVQPIVPLFIVLL
jgi:hypothetical protein